MKSKVALVQVSEKSSANNLSIVDKEVLRSKIMCLAEECGAIHIYMGKKLKLDLDIVFSPDSKNLFYERIEEETKFSYTDCETLLLENPEELNKGVISAFGLSEQTVRQILVCLGEGDNTDKNKNEPVSKRDRCLQEYLENCGCKALNKKDPSERNFRAESATKIITTNFYIGWEAGVDNDVETYLEMLKISGSNISTNLQEITIFPFLYAYSSSEPENSSYEENWNSPKQCYEPTIGLDEDDSLLPD